MAHLNGWRIQLQKQNVSFPWLCCLLRLHHRHRHSPPTEKQSEVLRVTYVVCVSVAYLSAVVLEQRAAGAGTHLYGLFCVREALPVVVLFLLQQG
jgi:hypothetical protein